MITRQSLKLMNIFQMCLGNTIFKVTIIKTNQVKHKSLRGRKLKKKVFFKTQIS